MDFEKPKEKDFTVYSKSDCINCRKIKDLLKSEKLNFVVIDCDEYLFEDKENFLSFINHYTKSNCRVFPMVFYNGEFVGGFNETKSVIDKLIAFNFYY